LRKQVLFSTKSVLSDGKIRLTAGEIAAR